MNEWMNKNNVHCTLLLYKMSLQYRRVNIWKDKENEMYKIDNRKLDN